MSIAIYHLYSTNNVFDDMSVNIVCNQIMQHLTDQSFSDFDLHFGLTGEAGNCYENSLPGPIEQVKFATDSPEIYLFIANKLGRLIAADKMEKYAKRLIVWKNEIVFEFYLEQSITTASVNGIFVTQNA